MAMVTGAHVTAKALHNMGVDTIFYIIGGPVTPILEECKKLGMKMVDVRHEQCASNAAHAYSRLRGKPGVCITPSGPATANSLPGLANALADASPVISIGGSTALNQRGTGAFQEMDQMAVMTPAVKQAVQAILPERVPQQLSQLYRRAMEGVKGPVYLDMPADVVSAQLEEETVSYPTAHYVEPRSAANPESVKAAIEILRQAKRPLVVSGSGVIWSQASKEIQEFVDGTGIPFMTTPQGRGVIPEDHRLSFPAARTTAFKEADAVLVVGTRSNFILSYFRQPRWAADAKFIMVNIDGDEMNHNRRMDVALVGDAREVLKQLTAEAKGKFDPKKEMEWVRTLAAKHAANEEKNEIKWNSTQTPIHPMRMMAEVRKILKRDGVLVVDGHDTLNFGRQSLPTHTPGHRINSGTHGTMGISVPFGIGAKAAMPNNQVVVVCGDGSFGWLGTNIDSAVRNKLGILFVVNNNGGMTASPEGSKRIEGHNLGHSNLHMVCQAYGGYGERVENPEDIAAALQRGLKATADGIPAVINVITDSHARSSTYMGFFGEAGEYS